MLEARLEAALRGTPLERTWREVAAPALARWGDDARAERLDDAVVRGLARVLATSAEAARFLAHRSTLFDRLLALDAAYLATRAAALEAEPVVPPDDDLEAFLDGLRLARREETFLAAVLDLGGIVGFERVSEHLSRVAEAIVRDALAMAERRVSAPAPRPPVAVVAMGKLGGRELTYHSDLDVIFLYEGGPEHVAAVARVAQRLISYLSTMTGAGVAYAVDARLRPSGQQGTLVTSMDAFARYQCEQAQLWEHLVLMRARAFAGATAAAGAALAKTQAAVLARGVDPWPEVARMRQRVEAERAAHERDRLAWKTGPGGLMDADFLAAGGVLERGCAPLPPIPSVGALLRHAVSGGAGLEAVLRGYGVLRRLEARARWVAGRAIESLPRDGAEVPVVAELFEPGCGPEALLTRVEEARRALRSAFEAVVSRGTIDALAEAEGAGG